MLAGVQADCKTAGMRANIYTTILWMQTMQNMRVKHIQQLFMFASSTMGGSSEPPKLPLSMGLKGLIGGWELHVNCCYTHYSMHSYTLPFQESAKKTVITGKPQQTCMVAEKDTFAFFAFSFLKSDFRVSNRIFATHIGFSRFISDFRVSYRIFASHISKSYFRASNWIQNWNQITCDQKGAI